jgi:tetratricopeptide (TPR) repeat protein
VLYEMLAGQPPFSGRTAQAIVARHMQERPPSITVVRPTVPAATVRALEIALAKVPADRFQTAEQFVEALETSSGTSAKAYAERRPMMRRRVVLAAGALATVGLLVWLALPRPPSLDPNRVMVFPLRDAGQPGDPGVGEDVATYIGHVLDGSEPLRWDEGRDWLTSEQRADPGRLSPADVRGISRSHGARFYIDGSIVREADSTTVILRLFDVAADSLLKRAGRSGPGTSSEAKLGALAVGDLLPSLLESGRRVDGGALRERRPAAIANFLQGEREYREGRFEEALRHYQAAVQEDSLFALAAVKGAFAGTWGEDLDEVARLAGIAVRGDAALPARYTHFARGLRHYVPGSADSAVAEFQHAIRLAPNWEEAWMALGEVYRHLLPDVVGHDSLAEDAFRKARSLDPEFTPPLYHLFEKAIHADRLEEATRLLDTLGRAPLDSALGRVASLLLRCARGEMRDGDWTAAATGTPGDVLDATRTLSTAVSHRRCAEVGLRAVIASDSASPAHRFNALFGLQSLLVQQRRYGEVRELLRSPAAAPLGGPFFFLNDAFADPAFEVDAREIVRQQGSDYPGMSPVKLWLLGTWEAYHGTRDALAAVEKSLWLKADSSGQGRDSTLARIVAGHASVAAGDTNLAMERLSALKPGGTRQDITWSLWSSMGLERLTLARLLLHRGEHAEAIRVASVFDSPEPTLYLLFLAPSLALRAQAAQALGDDGLASRYRARLAVLINPKR